MYRIKLICAMCMIMLALAGCWDATDIDDLAVPIVGGYDVAENGDDFRTNDRVTVSGVFPLFSEDVLRSATVGTNIGKTIGESRTKRALKTPQQLLYGVIQAAVYSEEISEKGLNSYMDILLRNPQVKLNSHIAIAEGRTEDLLRNKITEYPNIGDYIIELLRNSPKDSFIPATTLHEFALMSYSVDKNPVVPIIKPAENSELMTGLGIFKKDIMIARVGTDEARIVSFLRGVNVEGFLPFKVVSKDQSVCEGSVKIKNSRKVKVSREGDHFTFNLDVKLKGDLVEYFYRACPDDKSSLLKDIENSIKLDIEKQCMDFLKKMQKEYKIDCIDITRYARAKWHRDIIDEIDHGFIEDVSINVNVNVDIFRKGELE